MSLARRNIGYHWRQFFGALSVLMFSGCLIYVAIGISVESYRSIAAHERNLNVDFFIESIASDNNRIKEIDRNLLYTLESIPYISKIEVASEKSTTGRFKINGKPRSIPFFIISSDADGMDAPKFFGEKEMKALTRPGSIIVAKSLASNTNLVVGDVIVNDHGNAEAIVVGILGGELGRGNIIGQSRQNYMTLESAQYLGIDTPRPDESKMVASFRIRLVHPLKTDYSKAKLDYILSKFGLKTVSPTDYGKGVSLGFLIENKAFQGLMIVGMLSIIIPLFIVVQTLRSIILRQEIQFATMRALGVPGWRLMFIAIEQALWVGLLGAALSYCGMLGIKSVLLDRDIFMHISQKIVVNVSLTIVGACLFAGIISLPAIFKTKLVSLLR